MLPIAFGKGTRAQERESTNGISRAERKGVFEASRVRPAFISRLYLEVSLSPWPEQPHPPPWGGVATACHSRLPCLRLAPGPAAGFV